MKDDPRNQRRRPSRKRISSRITTETMGGDRGRPAFFFLTSDSDPTKDTDEVCLTRAEARMVRDELNHFVEYCAQVAGARIAALLRGDDDEGN